VSEDRSGAANQLGHSTPEQRCWNQTRRQRCSVHLRIGRTGRAAPRCERNAGDWSNGLTKEGRMGLWRRGLDLEHRRKGLAEKETPDFEPAALYVGSKMLDTGVTEGVDRSP
jgi:hypothetical protein